MMSYVQFRNVKKVYKTGEVEIHALKDVSFNIDKGEFCVIVGASGAGKTTILNILGGMDTLSEGSAVIDGTELAFLRKRQLTAYRRYDVGFVFQFYNLIPDLTVRENVQSVRDISDDPFDIDEMLESLGIKDYASRFPRELSGGQQQRVAIARALVKNPKILLCDELTGALDSKSSRMVLGFLEKIHEKYATTIIIVTHNEAISQMADIVIRVQDGNIRSVKENKERVSSKDIVF